MRIVWIGFHVEGVDALRALLKEGYQVQGIVTLAAKEVAKRSGAADYPSVAQEFDVPLYPVSNINDEESIRLLERLNADVVFVIGWSQILRPEVLRLARLGMIGAHASLLPHNRGSAPINWAIIHGEKVTGNSLIWLAEGVDSGDVIDQMEFSITPYDTCATLYKKVAATNKEMILRVLPRLAAGERPGRKQEHSDESILPRRRPKDGLIDWNQSSEKVYDFIRALTRPYPGAFSYLRGSKYRIWMASNLPAITIPDVQPGEVIGPVISPTQEACGQLVACQSGALILLEVEEHDGERLSGFSLSDQNWKGEVWENVSK